MKIRYLGPSPSVNVGEFGPHYKDEVKDYPDKVGKELLATMRKQRFELVADPVEEKTESIPAAHETTQEAHTAPASKPKKGKS